MTATGGKDMLKAVAVGAVASVLLYISGLLVVFTPLPALYIFMRRGPRDGIATVGVSLATVMLVYAVVFPALHGAADSSLQVMPGAALAGENAAMPVAFFGIAYFVFFMVVTAVLGLGIGRRWTFARWVGAAVAAGACSVIMMAVVAEAVTSASLVAGARDYIRMAVGEIVRLNKAAGMAPLEARYIAEHQEEIAQFVLSVVPSIVFVFTLLVVVLNAFMVRRIAGMSRVITCFKGTMSFRVPDALVWFVIAGGAMFFADHYLLHCGWLRIAAINVLVALGSVYFLQGFAVAAYFLGRVRVRFVRFLAYATIIIFFQSVGLVLVGLGLADVWANFRARAKAAVGKGC